MNDRAYGAQRLMPVLALGLMLLGSTGCSLRVNPFVDELAGQGPVVTPSMEGARAAEATPSSHRRAQERIVVRTPDGTVTHGPLYFEDGFADGGSDDGQFAWTAEDYGQLFYWRARFLLNTAFFPLSVLCTPPCTEMESDGEPSRRVWGFEHDAVRKPQVPACVCPRADASNRV